MLIYPGMIEEPARKAGMSVPKNLEEYDATQFPHWHVFCRLQLCRPMKMNGEQWRNAKLIAGIPTTKVRTMTLEDFLRYGLEYSQ